MVFQQVILGLGLIALSAKGVDKPQISVLTIEVDNVVTYIGDVNDPAKLAAVAGATTPGSTKAFTETITVGDIVSMNGKPAKGLWSSRGYIMGYSPTAPPGFAVSDVSQRSIGECRWEIQNQDGLLVGRFMEGGLFPHQVSGGTGLFLGIRGQQSVVQATKPPRIASMTEDPSQRRAVGGGNLTHTFHLVASYPPAIEGPGASPRVYHSDFSPVSEASPARAGDLLIVVASNLGLTTPLVTPGSPFSTAPYNAVNGPVLAVVGGHPAASINALGWPGEVNVYRVDFRVPDGVASGMVDLQLDVDGIVGPAVKIALK